MRQGAIELLFFVLPFGLLAVVLARLQWSRAWALTLYVQLAVMALVFAVIGIVQYETRNIFWNPKVKVDNAYAPSGWFYRVNSVFYDPSIYGRFLVIGIVGQPRPGAAPARATRCGGSRSFLTIGITWAGLLPSFSQSSFVALIAAIVVGGVVAWRRARAGCSVAAGIATWDCIAADPSRRRCAIRRLPVARRRADDRRSSRKGVKVAVHHPVIGVGVGGFRRAYKRSRPLKGQGAEGGRVADDPVTVAAEPGCPASCSSPGSSSRRSSRRSGGSSRCSTGRTSRVRCSLGRYSRALPLLQRALRGPRSGGCSRLSSSRRGGSWRRRSDRGIRRALVLAPHTDDGEFGAAPRWRASSTRGRRRYVAFSIATRSLPEGSRRTRGARGAGGDGQSASRRRT